MEYDMKVVCERMKDGKVTARTTVEYFGMDNKQTVDVQDNIAQALVALGRRDETKK